MSAARRTKLLLTGFEPFRGDSVNPSAQIAAALDGATAGVCSVVGRVLPCVFGESSRVLRSWIDELRPSAVVCLGVAVGRAAIMPERVALNIDDARIPDNAGRQPVDEPIVAGAPAALWSTLPIKAIVEALAAREIPAAVSNTAGTFVCNHVFHALLHHLRRRRGVPAGFIHVPGLPEQVKPGEPSLPLDRMIEGIRVALEVVAAQVGAVRRSRHASTSDRGTRGRA